MGVPSRAPRGSAALVVSSYIDAEGWGQDTPGEGEAHHGQAGGARVTWQGGGGKGRDEERASISRERAGRGVRKGGRGRERWAKEREEQRE